MWPYPDAMPSPSTRAGLLLVDLQPLTLGNARTRPADELIADLARLADAFRGAGLPVAHVVSLGMPDGATTYAETGRAWPEELTVIAPDVAPQVGETVVRRFGLSAFAGTDLDAQLRAQGVSTLVVAGIATQFGVESTARDAYDRGFSVLVASDGVAGPDPVAHESTLTRTVPVIGRITTIADVIDGLVADA